MINRRKALVAIGVAAFSGFDSLASGIVQEGVADNSLTSFGAQLVNAVDDSVSANLASLEGRVYSEEGIPMFLACEDLSGNQSSRAPIRSAVNKKLASALHRYSAEWQRIHPQAPAADVAKIIELLADLDFAKGGAERSL